MSLFPLTYRLCNPIIELPCGGVSFPKASAKVQPTNQTAKLFHDFFQTFLYHRHTKHLPRAPHNPGKQKHKHTQKIYRKNTKKHTQAGRQRKTTRKKTQNAIFEKRDVLFKLTRLCFLHHGRQDGGTKY